MSRDDRGILYPHRLPSFERIAPPPSVEELVEWFWIPEWSLPPGRVSRQHLIAFSACNLVVEPDLVGLSGAATTTSFRDLTGSGWAVGALLRPAAVAALVPEAAAARDRYVRLEFPRLHDAVAASMTSDGPIDQRHHDAVAAFADWLGRTAGTLSDDALSANAVAAALNSDPTITSPAELADRYSVSVRTLQRMTARYVGLSPAAMIRRRRLQEAAERIRSNPATITLADLAAELGYSDQAHLAADFRTVLGFTASQYRKDAAGPAASPRASAE